MNNYYTANTNNIEVSVKSIYIEANRNSDNIFLWRYHVKIINKSSESVQLIRRYWKIIDEDGKIEEVYGDGVLGKQPVLMPNFEFEYSSQVYLKHPSGIMGGYYEMQHKNGSISKIRIPSFSLDVPHNQITIN